MRVLVLVHGGGQGGWCWQACARLLRAAGHEVYTPTLTGFGERGHLVAAGFETYVEDVVKTIEFEDLDDVVLVGHSMGGVIIPRVAERVRERIASVVWLAAVVTADGESLLQAVPQSPWIARAVKLRADGTAHTDPLLILDASLQDATPEQRETVRRRYCAYPPHALVEPGRLTAFLALGLPTAYVTATQDRTIVPELCAKFASRLPGCRQASIAAGHGCMITRPDETARALLEVSAHQKALA
jgi:pimeloyl-ACP methyl ester carboxylesterase